MQSALLPTLRPGLSVRECGAEGYYPPLCLPCSQHSESGPLGLSVHECGATGSASGQTACPVRPTLLQSWSHHSNLSPLCPSCPSPHLLPVWMNVYFLFPWCRTSLPFDFPSVLVVRGGALCLRMLPSWFSSVFVFHCLVSLSIMLSSSIHAIAKGISSFFLSAV